MHSKWLVRLSCKNLGRWPRLYYLQGLPYLVEVTQVTAGRCPVVIKILDDGLLPFHLRSKLKNSLLMGFATSEMTNERVNIRLERLAIFNQDGSFFETSVVGHVQDRNYFGIRARKVERAGPTLWKAFATSFMGSLGDYYRDHG